MFFGLCSFSLCFPLVFLHFPHFSFVFPWFRCFSLSFLHFPHFAFVFHPVFVGWPCFSIGFASFSLRVHWFSCIFLISLCFYLDFPSCFPVSCVFHGFLGFTASSSLFFCCTLDMLHLFPLVTGCLTYSWILVVSSIGFCSLCSVFPVEWCCCLTVAKWMSSGGPTIKKKRVGGAGGGAASSASPGNAFHVAHCCLCALAFVVFVDWSNVIIQINLKIMYC